MKELIARLEAATEGSRELDLAICEALGRCGDDGGRTCPNLCYSYSTSIDAALTLVPKGMEISITDLYGVPMAEVGLNASNYGGPWRARLVHGTLTLALCIAALKARS